MFGVLAFGPKAIQLYSGITVPLRFMFLIILAIYYGGLNSSVNGDGMKYYLGGKALPLPSSFNYACLALEKSELVNVNKCAE